VSESRCAHCGRELSDRDRHVRFGPPDAGFWPAATIVASLP